MNMVLSNIHNYKCNPSLILVTWNAMGVLFICSEYHGSVKMGEAGGSRKRAEDWTSV